MRRRGFKEILLAGVLLLPGSVLAANLVQVFNDACHNDPTYKAAMAKFYATKENVPISAANFFPQVNISAGLRRDRNDARSGPPAVVQQVYYNNQASYGINLDQSLFNFANWAKLANAKSVTKQEAANLSAAYQDLIIRTSTAYFDVLKASETLRFSQAEKRAISRQLEQNRERYKVGLIAITAVYETQASYDTAIAREIAAQNLFANNIEKLREITGRRYSALQGINKTIPLASPKPANMEQWVQVAVKQNYSLAAAGYGVLAAKDNVKLAYSGHLPVIDGFAGMSYSFLSNPSGLGAESVNKQANVGVNAYLPVFSGGGVSAQTRQACQLYNQAAAERERVYRSVTSSTRQAFLSILSGISQVRADKQTILSRESALKATEAAYEVGTRTMVDVLDAQSGLYNAQEVHAADQYTFLLNTLLLEQAAGTLSPKDLCSINRWLSRRVPMIPYNTVGKVRRIKGPRPENIKPIDIAKKNGTGTKNA